MEYLPDVLKLRQILFPDKMDINEICARKLKMLREVNNYSQEYVASVLDISQNAYSLIENGSTKITLSRIGILAKLYKISPAELISDEAFSFHASSQAVSTHNNFPPALSSFEKKMYEQTINRMETEIERLYTLLRQLTSNSAINSNGSMDGVDISNTKS